MHCIVLCLYIYIALLAVHTNQKRFQCERPGEKSMHYCTYVTLYISAPWHISLLVSIHVLMVSATVCGHRNEKKGDPVTLPAE